MKYIYLFILSLFLFHYTLMSQTSDNQLWTGASVGLKLNKNFSVNLTEQFRFDNNISSRKLDLTELGVKYKLNKHFSFAQNFRLIDIPLKKNKRRVSFDVAYSWKKKGNPFRFGYRFRLQDTKKFNSKKQASDYMRNKIDFGYNATKLVDPFIAYEFYFRFDGKNEFRKNRFTFGLDWKLNKKMSLTTYYRLQKETNVKSPETLNIIGITFDYKLSLKKLINKPMD